MATQEWLDAARNYSLMSESARSEYWQQLTPDQQGALSDALAATEAGSGTPNTASSTGAAGWTGSTGRTGTTGKKKGCGGPIGAGCLGMILGCILTIGVEFAAVSAGIDAIGKMFGGSESPRYPVAQEPERSNEPPEKDTEKRVGCEDRQYRRDNPLICGSEQSCVQECRERFSE